MSIRSKIVVCAHENLHIENHGIDYPPEKVYWVEIKFVALDRGWFNDGGSYWLCPVCTRRTRDYFTNYKELED